MTVQYLNEHFTTGTKWSSSNVTYNAASTARASQTYAAASGTIRFDQTYGINPLNTADQAVVEQVFAEWTKHINLTASSSTSATPNITVSYAKNIQSYDAITEQWVDNSGMAFKKIVNGAISQVDILIDPANSLQKGTWGYETLLHEVGHSLGLFTTGTNDHPHEISRDFNYTRDNTIMSYELGKVVDSTPNAKTPMMCDIAALQHLYGAKTTETPGNNTYSMTGVKQASTIWDAGGYDI